MITQLLSFAGWAYLPNIATRQLLPVFHHFYRTVLHRTPPAPGTPLYAQHFRYTYAFAILSYLLYNLFTAAWSVTPNYYEKLGVVPEAEENALKIAFRQFARKYHPDRVGAQGVDNFIEVRDAFEALKNPVTRFAYDRFGPGALKWTGCTTPQEFLLYGLIQSSGFYIVSGLVLLVWTFIGKRNPIAFWRYILFATSLVYELMLILYSPPSYSSLTLSDLFVPKVGTYPGVFILLWPRRVAYQHINLLHSVFVFLSLALSRVAPVFFMPPKDIFANPKLVEEELNKLTALARAVDSEVVSQIQTELRAAEGPDTHASTILEPTMPLEPSEQTLSTISREMENMIIENRLKRDPGPLRSAAQNAVMRRYHSEPPPSRITPPHFRESVPDVPSGGGSRTYRSRTTMGILSPSPTPTPGREESPPLQPQVTLRRSKRIRSRSSEASPSAAVADDLVFYVRNRSSSY